MNPFLLDILVIMLLVGALSLSDSATTVLFGDLHWAKRLLVSTLGTLILLIPLWLFVFSLSDPEKVFGYLSFVEILIGIVLWHAIWHFLENPFRIWLARQNRHGSRDNEIAPVHASPPWSSFMFPDTRR